jgi:hypothetical protein
MNSSQHRIAKNGADGSRVSTFVFQFGFISGRTLINLAMCKSSALFLNLASGSQADGSLFPSLRKYLPVSSNLNWDTMKLMAFLILILSACSSNNKPTESSYFEGKIVYRISAESKSPKINAEELLKLSGDSSVFYFKEGNYRQFYDADGLLEEYYIQKDNRGYIKKNNSDSLFWYDRAKANGEIIKFVLNKKKEKILGIECDELITTYNNKTKTYYFNPDSLKINKDWFHDFNYTNKNFVTQQTGALFLKCKMEYPEVIFTITATSVSHEKVNDKMFEIPQNVVLIEGHEN